MSAVIAPLSSPTLAALDDPRLLRALAWWQAKRGGRRLPDRAALDPREIPDLLPHIVMWERLPGEAGYRCRLAGTFMVQIHGHEFTGHSMAQFHGAKNAEIQPEYDWVARQGLPHYVERSLFWMNKDYQRYCRILLPFAWVARGRPADEVALILNIAHFF